MKDEPVPVSPAREASKEAPEETSLPGSQCSHGLTSIFRWRFMNAKVVITKDRRNHWLDMKNNRLPTGNLQVGIRQRYFEWCLDRYMSRKMIRGVSSC